MVYYKYRIKTEKQQEENGMKVVYLSDEQFEGLESKTRRSLMVQLFIIDTGKYRYELGVSGRYWTLNRYDREESTGHNQWPGDYKPLEVDKWI